MIDKVAVRQCPQTRTVIISSLWLSSVLSGSLSGMSSRKINYIRYFQYKRMYCLSPDKQKRRDCDGPIAHWPFFYYTHSFLLKGEESPKCIGCDKRLTIEHILLTCSDFIEIRESHFTAKSLRMLFQDILPERIFNFLKERNNFGKI